MDLFEELCKKSKLERDKALAELGRIIVSDGTDDVSKLSIHLLETLRNPVSCWEALAGCLEASCIILTSKKITRDEALAFEDAAFGLLENREFRVRMSAAQCIGKCSQFAGDASVYRRRKSTIFEAIRTNLVRETEHQQMQLINDSLTFEHSPASPDSDSRTRRSRSPSPSPPRSPSRSGLTKEEIFHDTAGWKSLETWMKCLEYTACGCGVAFLGELDTELFDLTDSCTLHVNRFVRESAYNLLAAIFSGEQERFKNAGVDADESATKRFGERVLPQMHRGLCDNWSQVRLAASIAARQLLLSCDGAAQMLFISRLIAPLCLNRYYAAEGVRTYAHETWRLVTHGEGVRLVERYIEEVVAFYIEQSEADNHAVREAACTCLAELGVKISREALKPHVPRMLTTLIECFEDESWPVRDGACVACGNLVQAFPEEAGLHLDTLVPLFISNLRDSIASVRQGAAAAIANLLKHHAQSSVTIHSQVLSPKQLQVQVQQSASNAESQVESTSDDSSARQTRLLLDLFVDLARAAFESVKDQPAEAERYSDVEKKPAVYGVIKRAHDNDAALHTDQTMYSCGSLAPKMGRKKRDLCACERALSRTFTRESQNWEVADGCWRLLGELAQLESPAVRDAVQKLLISAQKAVSHHHYVMHVALLETCCNVLPRLAGGLSIRVFKRYFEIFVDDIFYAAHCENRLTESAAADCLVAFSKMMGDQILRGRIQQCLQADRYLEIYERCLVDVANAPVRVSADAAVSRVSM